MKFKAANLFSNKKKGELTKRPVPVVWFNVDGFDVQNLFLSPSLVSIGKAATRVNLEGS